MAARYENMARLLLEEHEGKESRLYRCPAGKLTIGIGHNIEERGLSDAAIEFIFGEDLRIALRDGCLWLGEAAWLALDDVRKAVLADFAFNLGASRLGQFKGLRAALLARDYVAAGRSMRNSKWFGQVGNRGPRLAALMESGKWGSA